MTITVNANSDQADLPKASRTNELNDLLNCAPPPRHAELESLRQAARDRLHEQTLPTPAMRIGALRIYRLYGRDPSKPPLPPSIQKLLPKCGICCVSAAFQPLPKLF